MAKRKVKIPSTPGGLHGWHATEPAAKRRRILVKLVKKDSYATVVRRLNLLRIWNKNKKQDKAYRAATADWQFLQKKFRPGEAKARKKAPAKRRTRKAANPINKNEVSAVRGSWEIYERGVKEAITNATINSDTVELFATLRGMLTTLKNMRGERAVSLYLEKRDAFDQLSRSLKRAAPNMDVRNSSYRSVSANPKRRNPKRRNHTDAELKRVKADINEWKSRLTSILGKLKERGKKKATRDLTEEGWRVWNTLWGIKLALEAEPGPTHSTASNLHQWLIFKGQDLGTYDRWNRNPPKKRRTKKNPDYSGMQVIYRDGSIALNFKEAEKKAKKMSDHALRHSIKDAKAAEAAQPKGKKAGYYLDEVHVYAGELQRRRDAWRKEKAKMKRRNPVGKAEGRNVLSIIRKETEIVNNALAKGNLLVANKALSKMEGVLLALSKMDGKEAAELFKEGFSRWERISDRAERRGRVVANKPKRKKRRRTRSNPLLMTLTANPFEADPNEDPDVEFRRRAAKDGRPVRINKRKARRRTRDEIPFKQFKKWAEKNLEAKEKKRFHEEVAAYKRFHKAYPTTVKREIIRIGPDDTVMRDFAYSMGKSPTETYIAPKGSNKHGVTFLHENGDGVEADMPDVITNRKGKYTLKPLKGKAFIKEWMEH